MSELTKHTPSIAWLEWGRYLLTAALRNRAGLIRARLNDAPFLKTGF